ncbi:MAG: response regulator [Candidatus Rokubacteria bacterium]|nr:response regulator [Candidatus Rokubacteria bacterium]
MTTAASADAGLASLSRVLPDVVVCDIMMASHDGYWLLSALRATQWGASLPVVAVTGFDDVHPAARTLPAGFNGHVRKPVDPWELARLVGTLARGRG